MRITSALLIALAIFSAPPAAIAAPDLTVRMGQYHIRSNDAPFQLAGTLYTNIVPGETRTINLLLENRGDANLTISSPAIIEGAGAAHFDVTFGPDTLIEPGQGSFLILVYSPDAVGIHEATLRLNSNDPDENPYLIPLQGQCTAAPTGAASIDLVILGYTATKKCNAKKGFCTAKGKATALNLTMAPSAGFVWMLARTQDGLFDQSSEIVASGFTKKIKAYKGFPATIPSKKAKFKVNTPIPGDTQFVLVLLPQEGDLDYSDNSILIELAF